MNMIMIALWCKNLIVLKHLWYVRLLYLMINLNMFGCENMVFEL